MGDVVVDAFVLLQAFQERLGGGARHGVAHRRGGSGRSVDRVVRVVRVVRVDRVVRVETEESLEVRLGDVGDDTARERRRVGVGVGGTAVGVRAEVPVVQEDPIHALVEIVVGVDGEREGRVAVENRAVVRVGAGGRDIVELETRGGLEVAVAVVVPRFARRRHGPRGLGGADDGSGSRRARDDAGEEAETRSRCALGSRRHIRASAGGRRRRWVCAPGGTKSGGHPTRAVRGRRGRGESARATRRTISAQRV